MSVHFPAGFDFTTPDPWSERRPEAEFAELRPRLVYDRDNGTLTARPGAQRLAVTSGGAIPDRGMFGVFLVGADSAPRRVGELDMRLRRIRIGIVEGCALNVDLAGKDVLVEVEHARAAGAAELTRRARRRLVIGR